jgi:hypothetical protein
MGLMELFAPHPSDKPKPEEWFAHLLTTLTHIESGDEIYFHSDGDVYMKYHIGTGNLWVDYTKIWRLFSAKFAVDDAHVSEMISNIMKATYGYTKVVPLRSFSPIK